MDWILTLSLGTFVLVLCFLAWNRISTKRLQATGGKTAGLGGPNDPLSGAAEGIRSADQLRGSLDDAQSVDAARVARNKP